MMFFKCNHIGEGINRLKLYIRVHSQPRIFTAVTLTFTVSLLFLSTFQGCLRYNHAADTLSRDASADSLPTSSAMYYNATLWKI